MFDQPLDSAENRKLAKNLGSKSALKPKSIMKSPGAATKKPMTLGRTQSKADVKPKWNVGASQAFQEINAGEDFKNNYVQGNLISQFENRKTKIREYVKSEVPAEPQSEVVDQSELSRAP